MNKKVLQIFPGDWKEYSESAHMMAFKENRSSDMDRIDYALLVINSDNDTPLGYVTVRELDAESVYWQYGGATPASIRSITSYRTYEEMIKWTSTRYKRITTLIENDNIPMLKFAMSVGYRIIGCRTFKNSILLEHLIEFDKE